MQHRLFVESAEARQRYWFRAAAGWARFARAQPSPVHTRLATWQTNNQIDLIATQNVDGLHQRAGSASVIDLHGRLDQVVCLDCGDLSERDALQRRLLAANPDTLVTSDAATRPDGDTEQSEVPPDFTVPSCTACGGRLKPHVVFYGDTVPRERVEALESALHRARSLLTRGALPQRPAQRGRHTCRSDRHRAAGRRRPNAAERALRPSGEAKHSPQVLNRTGKMSGCSRFSN